MTPAESRHGLEELIGTELGTGEWMLLTADRIRLFDQAMGRSTDQVPALMLLALIPALTSTIALPLEGPLTAINYGLDQSRFHKAARPGDRIRARATLLEVEDGSGWLQLKRAVVLENDEGDALLNAETLTRMFW